MNNLGFNRLASSFVVGSSSNEDLLATNELRKRGMPLSHKVVDMNYVRTDQVFRVDIAHWGRSVRIYKRPNVPPEMQLQEIVEWLVPILMLEGRILAQGTEEEDDTL